MENNAPQILTELIDKKGITKELLASKFKVSINTIHRWKTKETTPTFSELEKLNRIYNGYKAQETK